MPWITNIYTLGNLYISAIKPSIVLISNVATSPIMETINYINLVFAFKRVMYSIFFNKSQIITSSYWQGIDRHQTECQ